MISRSPGEETSSGMLRCKALRTTSALWGLPIALERPGPSSSHAATFSMRNGNPTLDSPPAAFYGYVARHSIRLADHYKRQEREGGKGLTRIRERDVILPPSILGYVESVRLAQVGNSDLIGAIPYGSTRPAQNCEPKLVEEVDRGGKRCSGEICRRNKQA